MGFAFVEVDLANGGKGTHSDGGIVRDVKDTDVSESSSFDATGADSAGNRRIDTPRIRKTSLQKELTRRPRHYYEVLASSFRRRPAPDRPESKVALLR